MRVTYSPAVSYHNARKIGPAILVKVLYTYFHVKINVGHMKYCKIRSFHFVTEFLRSLPINLSRTQKPFLLRVFRRNFDLTKELTS